MAIVIPFTKFKPQINLKPKTEVLSEAEVEQIHTAGFSTIGMPKTEVPIISPAETIRKQFEAEQELYPEKYKTPIKIPFTKSYVSVPKSDVLTPIVAGFATGILEAIPSFAKTLYQIPSVVKKGELPTPTGKEAITSAWEIGGTIRNSLIEGGMDEYKAHSLGTAAAAGLGIVDAWFSGSITKGIIKQGLRLTEKNVIREIAWSKLGQPTTLQEAEMNWKALQRVSHPDMPGGSEALSRELNQSMDILRSEGLPSKLSSDTRQVLRALNQTPQEFAKYGFHPNPEVVVPFSRVKGYLPGQATVGEPQPAFGMSIQPVKKVGYGIKMTPAGEKLLQKPSSITLEFIDWFKKTKPEWVNTAKLSTFTDGEPYFFLPGIEGAQITLRDFIKSQEISVVKKVGGVPEIPKDLQPLAQEARKYKSAEEFVEAQGTPVYHGTPKEFEKFDLSFVGERGRTEGRGFYFTDKKGVAKVYTSKPGEPKIPGEGRIIEAYLDIKKPMSLKQRKITDNQLRKIIEEASKTNESLILSYGESVDDVVRLIKENKTDVDIISELGNVGVPAQELNNIITKITGYDGIIQQMSDGKLLVAFNPEQIMTKSQLTDFWEKSNLAISKNTERGIKVDPIGEELLNKHTFSLNADGYPVTKQDGKVVYLHDLVMGIEKPKGFEVDHINGNKLDNRLENLRVISHKANISKMELSVRNTSGIKGVQFDKNTNKWVARITVDNKNIHLGSFPTVDEAVKARKTAETKYFEPLYNQAVGGVKEVSYPKEAISPKPTQILPLDKISPLEELNIKTGEIVKGGGISGVRGLKKVGLEPEKPSLITRREDVLLRQRIRDEARGAKIGAVEARQITRQDLISKFKSSRENVRQIKNDLIKYIDENLPAEAKGKLTQSLMRDNLTRKNAASIFSRVEIMKETLTRKELVGEIKGLSVPKGNLAVDYQKQITETIAGIDLVKPTEATIKKLKGLRDFIQREGVPLNIQSKYLEKLNRLTKKNVGQLTTEELTELKDTLNQLQTLGKLKQDLKYKYNERERKIALDKLLASTQNIDPKITGVEKWDMAKAGTKKAYMDTLHTPRVADMIDGFGGYRGENAKYIKNLGRKETLAKENTRGIVNSALEEIQKLGVEELTEEQQIRMMINIRYREGAFDQVKTLLEKNGLKEVPKPTEQENQIIEIIKKYTNQYTDDIVAIFEEIENQPFNKLKEYILPIKYEKEFNLVPSQTIEQGRFRTTQTFKGFTFERQKGVEKTPRTDILAIFEEAINEQQWYLNMQPELENIKYLVKSEDYLAKGGEMASNWWRNELDLVARRGWSATARSHPMLRQGRINLNQAILGYKVSSILMQPFAVFDAMAYAQSRYGTTATLNILYEFSKAWIIPKYAKNIIAESPVLQQRQAGELAIEETLKKLGRAKGLWNKVVRGGMSLLQKADVRTAAGVQQGLENILTKHGVPNAKEEAEFLMNLVSGSNEVSYRPHILASGEGARTWFTFQTFFLNRWGIVIHDLIRSGIIKGGGEAGWKGIWKRFSALIGLGIFIAGSIAENESRKAIYEITTGKGLPDESLLKQAIMFIPEQIPYFGNLIEMADRGGDANPPLIRTVENVFTGGASVIKGVKPETKIKGALKMGEAGLILGAGVPGTAQFFDLLERIFLEEKKKTEVGGLKFGFGGDEGLQGVQPLNFGF